MKNKQNGIYISKEEASELLEALEKLLCATVYETSCGLMAYQCTTEYEKIKKTIRGKLNEKVN